jgi:LAS superfamily LD-carboxypeptidase LdcB
VIAFTGLDPRLKDHATQTVAYANRLGIRPAVISVRRSYGEQLKLYTDYKAGLRQWPAAPPGQSAHEYGVAWDSTVPRAQLATWTAVRRAFGWFVPDGDPNHAEYPGWSAYRSQLSAS